jgi:hypothetical protein
VINGVWAGCDTIWADHIFGRDTMCSVALEGAELFKIPKFYEVL